jgi:hypothetical protein
MESQIYNHLQIVDKVYLIINVLLAVHGHHNQLDKKIRKKLETIKQKNTQLNWF